ncbi:hypothetical protein AB0M91_19510 [Micromonospora rifamycinica]|uniref:hypothetical protein n=1 Tax=Micromonospora rifamycinica TaxID=291594 RepID=UPI00341EA660
MPPLIQSGMPLLPELLNDPTAVKTTDTSRISTVTLAADPDLTVPVIAGAVYLVNLYAPHTYNAAGDFKIGWTYPSGSTLPNWQARWRTTDGVETSGSFADITSTVAITSASGSLNQPVWAHGLLTIGALAGQFAFAWAQNTSNANATIVRAGAVLRLERIA